MKRIFPLLLVLALGPVCFGGEAPARVNPVLAVSQAVSTPRLHAEADDPAWQGPQGGVQLSPVAGGRMVRDGAKAYATSVEALWDKNYLYIRYWCRSSADPWAPHGAERDAMHSDGDVVEVFLDPVGDARQFVEVQVSPANGVFDKLYLLTGEPRFDTQGMLLSDVLRRDQWEFADWNWEGLISATSTWKQDGTQVGWIVDLALPAKPLLRRLNLKAYQAGLELHAHFVRNACPVDPLASSGGRAFMSFSWSQIPLGRPHRAPAAMGELRLAK